MHSSSTFEDFEEGACIEFGGLIRFGDTEIESRTIIAENSYAFDHITSMEYDS